MSSTSHPDPTTTVGGSMATAGFRPTDQQVAYYDAFGFVHFPGLFASEMDRITAGFEEVFASNPTWDTHEGLHFDELRSIIPAFVTKSEDLSWLLDDDRVKGIVSTLLGPEGEYAESDGNVFSCETSWHADSYAAPLHKRHLKLSFYLDPLTAESGAIRLIPGTNEYMSEFAKNLRRNVRKPEAIADIYGVEPRDLPSWTVASQPGDLIVWNFRTVHASFSGGTRRRLFSINYKEPDPEG